MAPSKNEATNGGALTVALDAMGGDKGPDMVVRSARIALERQPDVRFLLFGDAERIEPVLAHTSGLSERIEVRHTPDVVTNEDRPSQALRQGRKSSMRLAIDAVVHGEAQCVVSAGNTGALMAMAKFALKMLPGIDRPAIASFFPTLRGESVMLDLGANVDCRAEHLVQFALMGAIFVRVVLGLPRPTIGLLNIGAEALKGRDELRDAAQRLRELEHVPGDFYGFVEGNDIPAGTVDVVVTDGFTGNVALKTAEGTASLYSEWLRRTFRSSLSAKLGYFFARSAFRKLRKRTDPRAYNGAMFLGLNGICVKSHGGTDPVGFAHAIDVGVGLVRDGFNDRVKQELSRIAGPKPPPEEESAAPTAAAGE